MQLHLDGSASINTNREKAFALLTDPSFLAKTIPDADDVRVLDATSLEARVKMRVAVVSTALKLKMTVSQKQHPSTATLVAEGSGSGSNLKIVSTFNLAGDSPVTMAWTADADIGGVMAGLGSTMLKGFATKKVGEILGGITGAIERAAG